MSTSSSEEIFTTLTNSTDNPDVSVMCLCGELDASTVPGFLADVQNVMCRHHDVIMDVHLLSYVDSTGVAAISSTKNALRQAGKKLLLVGAHGLLSKIINVTQMCADVPCCDDLDSALAELGLG